MGHDNRLSMDVLLSQQGRIRTLARGLVRDAASADDLVQDALVAALQRPAAVHGDGRGWTATVLGNLARDRVRSDSRRARRDESAARREAQPGVDEAVIAAERQRELVDSVLALDEPYRGVVLLRFFEELPPREIVKRTGRSSETVKKQLQRGLEKLRARLEERFGKDGAWAVALLPLTGDGVVRGGALAGGLVIAKRAAIVVALVGGGALGARSLWPEASNEPLPVHPRATELEDTRVADVELSSPTTEAVRAQAGPSTAHRSHGEHSTSSEPSSIAPEPRTYDPPFRALVVDAEGDAFEASSSLCFEYRVDEYVGLERFEDVIELRPDSRGWIETDRAPNVGRLGELLVKSGDFAILAVGRESRDAVDSRVVVLPAVTVAGVVVDGAGQPVEGAEVSVRADLESLGTYAGGLLTAGSQRMWRVESDAAGHFDLGRVPYSDRFELEASAEVRGRTSVDLPQSNRSDLVLELPSDGASVAAVAGRVVEADGSPVAGARVRLAWFDAVTDDEGAFRIEARSSRFEDVASDGYDLSASAPDGRFVRCAFSIGAHGEYVLRLPVAMASIGGRVVTADEVPIHGATVYVYDGTRRGSSSSTLEGQSTLPEVARRTSHDGSFVVENLEQRPYHLRVIRSDPFFVLDAEGVLPGTTDLVLRAPEGHVVEGVEGRVLDFYGQPLAGAEIWPSAYANAPGGTRQGIVARISRTDADGRFVLAALPRRGASLSFRPRANDGRNGESADVENLDLDHPLEITLDPECELIATLREGAIGATLEFVNADGERLDVSERVPNGISFRRRAQQLEDGTFRPLLVRQSASRVRVLDGADRLLRTVDLRLEVAGQNVLEL